MATSSIGTAAHICAAAPGGPRYDADMSSNERSGIDNGIWLCAHDGRLIDTDVVAYTAEVLKRLETLRYADEVTRRPVISAISAMTSRTAICSTRQRR